ncbi:MAG: hypothetical protein LW863_20160 [Flammeovirgaceae bacterium]|jgi:hypothetical protein|nr:hypothetical protein [Flammeovirgaceae bacterium]
MKFDSLLMRHSFLVKTDYEKMRLYFKSKLDVTYFKGYLDRDETQLFYNSGAMNRPLSVNLPMVQLNIENKPDPQGNYVIKFKIVDLVLIFFGITNSCVITFFIVGYWSGGENLPIEILLIFFLFTYGSLQFRYRLELVNFEKQVEILRRIP